MVNFIYENLFGNRNKQDTLRSKLKQNLLFQDLSAQELKLVENIVNVRNYRPGESVFKQGEVGVGMYIIVSGSVNIYVEELDANSNQMNTSLVTQLKSGDFFGELALVEQESRRSASASANEDCVLIGFYKPDLMEIVERNSHAGVKILLRLGEILGVRLRQTTARITQLKKDVKK